MNRKARNSCIYKRGKRWWGDFRSYADVGGKLEMLKADGERLATTDRKVASILHANRVKHYEAMRRNRAMTGIAEHAELSDYAEYHLAKLRRAANADPTARPRLSTIERYARALTNVIDWFGPHTLLTEITPERLGRYIEARRKQQGRHGERIKAATIHQELTALSRLMKRALSEHKILVNPVSLCVDRPRIVRQEAEWLEIEEAAKLLAVAGQLDAEPVPPGCSNPIRFLRSLIATALLTGGRNSEICGLEGSDVDFVNGVVRFRENRWRRLKRGGERAVPLWPQLREILTEYLNSTPPHISGLLFPSPVDGKPLRTWRASLKRACERAEINKRVTPHTLRHTYTAARLQTYHTGPNGELVQLSAYHVARELGHSSTNMIERVYGHILQRGNLLPEVKSDSEEAEQTKRRPSGQVS